MGDAIEDSLELHLVGFSCGRLVCKLIVLTTLTRCFFHPPYFDLKRGFVALSSVGAHPWAKRMGPDG